MSTIAAPALATPQQPVPLVANQQPGNSASFGDILDAVNPLQHIPILSTLYRSATGSQISPGAEIAGDTLYGALLPGGALVGLASSVADVAVKETTGSDIGQHVLSTLAAPSTTTAATATPLVASPQTAPSAGTQNAALNTVNPLARISQNTHAGNAQYERAQAFDALNTKLVKMV